MIDARKILEELQTQATTLARDFDVETKLDDAKRAAASAREKIETDEGARNAAVAAGGLLLAGLLGTKGGRRMIGGVAKTGLVAGLGALAYKAWQDHQTGDSDAASSEDRTADSAMLQGAGFPITHDDPTFALGVLHAMIAAANADGVITASERAALDGALDRAGATAEERRALLDDQDLDASLEVIARAATSSNHAAELYAAAAVVVAEPNSKEAAFLARLADRLNLGGDHAAAIGRRASL